MRLMRGCWRYDQGMYPEQLLIIILIPIAIFATYFLIRVAVYHGMRDHSMWKLRYVKQQHPSE